MVKLRPFQIEIRPIKINRGSIQLIFCKRFKKIIWKQRKRSDHTDSHAVDGKKKGEK